MSAPLVSSKRPSRRKQLAASVAAVLALSASVASHAAATWFVNDCTDDTTAGHFRWAVNGAVSGDTIDLTTQLTPAGYPNCTNAVLNGFNHTLLVGSTVTLAAGVTIQGPGKDELAISALGLNARAISASGNLTINDLGVKYGGGTSPSTGACIRATNDITLTNVRAYHCYSYSNAGSSRGGAVYSFLGGVTMTGSTVDKSAADSVSGSVRGGAVYGFTSVSLTDSTITNSTATTQTGSAEGGGIWANTAGATLTGSYVTGTAYVTGAAGHHAYGGGVYSRGSANLYSGSFVRSGKATTASTTAADKGLGGGIAAGSIYVKQSNIWYGHTAAAAGAARGGNLYSKAGATVKYSSLQLGSAKRGGGAYAINGFTSKYSLIHGNNASGGGGGVISKGGNSSVRGTTVSFNSGFGWSGLDLYPGGASTITIRNSTIVHNTGSNSTGALYLKAYTTTLDNSTVAYNTSASGSSAAFVTGGNAGSTFDMNSTLFASNASGAGRNDLFVDSSAPFTVTSSNNFVRDPGSGVPTGTIVGECPHLRQIYSTTGWAFFMQRPNSKSLVIDAGSNPLNLTSDQRGDAVGATSPPRASGPGPNNPSPVPDIGAWEVDQDDSIFNDNYETCQ